MIWRCSYFTLEFSNPYSSSTSFSFSFCSSAPRGDLTPRTRRTPRRVNISRAPKRVRRRRLLPVTTTVQRVTAPWAAAAAVARTCTRPSRRSNTADPSKDNKPRRRAHLLRSTKDTSPWPATGNSRCSSSRLRIRASRMVRQPLCPCFPFKDGS